MPALHRHQLVRLTDGGWRAVLGAPRDVEARALLEYWAARRLPLVVTRQAPTAGVRGPLVLGLAAPIRWSRRRLALCVERDDVARYAEFPPIEALTCALTLPVRKGWQALCEAIVELGAPTRVYGSRGWQLLSGIPYALPNSDIDLWSAVADLTHADAVAQALEDWSVAGAPRLDGELLFPDGRAVAWREWRAWRAGRCRAILTKTLTGVSLVDSWTPSTAEDLEAIPC